MDWSGGKAFDTAKSAFESKYSNVTVEVQTIAWADYFTKLLTVMAAGSPPDVYELGESDVCKYWNLGLLADITPFTQGTNPMDMNDFYQTVKDVFTVDGKLPVICNSLATYAVYYNKKLFDAAGIPYPQSGWTWDDFKNTALKLTIKKDGKIVQWGASLPTSSDQMEPLINAFGGSILSPDGKTATGYLDSAKTVEAIKWYTDLVQTVSLTPDDQKAFGSTDSFTTNKVAMNVMGPWPLVSYEQDKDLSFGTVELPTQNGQKLNDLLYAGAYGIYSKSKNQQMGWNYIKELCDPSTDAGKMWAQFGLPATKTLAKDPIYSDPNYVAFLNELNTGIIKSAYFQNQYFRSAQSQYLNPALITLSTPPGGDIQAKLTEAAKQIDLISSSKAIKQPTKTDLIGVFISY